jgi:hypothetical protein
MIQESGWYVELLRSKIDDTILAAQILTSDREKIVARNVLGDDSKTVLARARVMAVAPEMSQLLKQIMAAHRGQLPSECADLYGGGCGCSQCEQARALLARIEGEG